VLCHARRSGYGATEELHSLDVSTLRAGVLLAVLIFVTPRNETGLGHGSETGR
jgi:hypothetical protein